MVGLFQSFEAFFTGMVQSGLMQTVSQLLAALQPAYDTAALIYIIFFGLQVMFRRMDAFDYIIAAGVLGVVGFLLSPGPFQHWIVDPIMQYPETLASSVTSSGNGQTTASSFDQLVQKIQSVSNSIDTQLSFYDFPKKVLVAFYADLCMLALCIGWGIRIFIKVTLLTVAMSAPVPLLLFIFPPLRGLGRRLFGIAMSAMIATVLVTVYLNFMVYADTKVLLTSYSSSQISSTPPALDGSGPMPEIGATNTNTTEYIQKLFTLAMMFFLNLMLMLSATVVSAFIGGGMIIPASRMAGSMGRFVLQKGRGF